MYLGCGSNPQPNLTYERNFVFANKLQTYITKMNNLNGVVSNV